MIRLIRCLHCGSGNALDTNTFQLWSVFQTSSSAMCTECGQPISLRAIEESSVIRLSRVGGKGIKTDRYAYAMDGAKLVLKEIKYPKALDRRRKNYRRSKKARLYR